MIMISLKLWRLIYLLYIYVFFFIFDYDTVFSVSMFSLHALFSNYLARTN